MWPRHANINPSERLACLGVIVAEGKFLSSVDSLGLLNQIADAAFVTDADLRIEWANSVAEAFFGVTLAAARGQSVLDLFPDTRGGPIEALYRDVLKRGEERSAELLYARNDRWLSVRALPHGSGLVAFYRDITRAQQAETALKQSEARYRMMAEHVSDVLIVSDIAGKCMWISPSIEAMLGYRPEELIGTVLSDLLHPDDLPAIDDEFAASDPHAPLRFTFRYRHKDGSWRWSETTGRVLFDDAGQPGESIFVARDVTNRMETRAALERSRDDAEATARAKSSFLANMSHEIRTPMNGVIGMTSLLADTSLSDAQRRFVSVIRSSGEMLLTLINDILDISKIEAGKFELERSETDVRQIVEEAVDLVAAQAAGAGEGAGHRLKVELISAVAPDVPAAICTDPTRLRQILVNLVGNALKFTPTGEVSVHVESEAVNDSQIRLQFEVRDTGIGISSDDIAKLFTPFTQLDDSRTRKFGGTGLGLSISQHLAARLGGAIAVSSAVGVGSTFRFDFVTNRVASPRPQLPTRPPSFVGKTMLIVDDNATNRAFLVRQLTAWEMKVDAVESAREALQRLADGANYDLALLNVQAIDGHGDEVAHAIRRLRPQLPLLLLREMGDRTVSRYGATLLNKPIKQGELFEAIASALGVSVASVQTSPAGSSADVHFEGLRVLLAEDNAINQMVAQLTLERLGIVADVAANGHEVLEAVCRQTYDVILMDIQMPELDGLEATARLRGMALATQPYIIAITAGALEVERQRALDAGMDALLTKPFTADKLALTLAARAPYPANNG